MLTILGGFARTAVERLNPPLAVGIVRSIIGVVEKAEKYHICYEA